MSSSVAAKAAWGLRSEILLAVFVAVLFRLEHPEIVRDDFEAAMLLTVLFPFARLDAPLDENQRALLEIFLRDLGLLSPHDDLVPFGALLALAVLVFVALIRRHRKIRNGRTSTSEARFGISAEAPHQDRFVHHQCFP